jgi:hypothetical protein
MHPQTERGPWQTSPRQSQGPFSFLCQMLGGIAANIAKVPELLQKEVVRGNLAIQQFDLTQRIINQVCVHIVLKGRD